MDSHPHLESSEGSNVANFLGIVAATQNAQINKLIGREVQFSQYLARSRRWIQESVRGWVHTEG